MASSILSVIAIHALLTAQVPIDEPEGQSTITVKKKKAPPEPPPPATPPPATPPPPPPAPIPRLAAPAAPVQRSQAISLSSVEAVHRGSSSKLIPWLTLGGSLAATAIGAFFAVRTTRVIDEQSELEFEVEKNSRVNVPEEFTDNQKAIFINGITATVLISAGISGAIASTVALTID